MVTRSNYRFLIKFVRTKFLPDKLSRRNEDLSVHDYTYKVKYYIAVRTIDNSTPSAFPLQPTQ